MAKYKRADFLSQSFDTAFDQAHSPGGVTPVSGIYRCSGCGREDASVKGYPLPPQNHHQHTTSQGRISWQLAVCVNHSL